MADDHVVLDIEIQRSPDEFPERWEATDKLGVACACVYEHRRDRFRVYGPGDVAALKARLLTADRVTGYNIHRFDLPTIWGLPGRERVKDMAEKTDDLLARIWQALGLNANAFSDLHAGWGLDAVARETLGRGKTGHGADAPKWFQAGNWARVVDYCLNDVALERDLGRFIDEHGFVVSPKDGTVLPIKPWAPADLG